MLDQPRKKKIVLHAHKNNYSKPTPNKNNIETISGEHTREEIGSSLTLNMTNNNNSLQIYEGDKRQCYLYLLQTESNRYRESGDVDHGRVLFGCEQNHQNGEGKDGGGKDRGEKDRKQEKLTIDVELKMESFKNKSSNIVNYSSLDDVHNRNVWALQKDRKLITSPNKRFLQITIKNTISHSLNSTLASHKLHQDNKHETKTANSSMCNKLQIDEQKKNVWVHGQNKLMELSTNCMHINLMSRQKSSGSRSSLKIKSHKYEKQRENATKRNYMCRLAKI